MVVLGGVKLIVRATTGMFLGTAYWVCGRAGMMEIGAIMDWCCSVERACRSSLSFELGGV